MIYFPGCPRPNRAFQFCDMGIRDPSFSQLVQSQSKRPIYEASEMDKQDKEGATETAYFKICRPEIIMKDKSKLHSDYVINHDIIKQQCKAKWISYGDECTKYFFAKVKQRKIATYFFEIKDAQGQQKQGFGEVAGIIQIFYKKLLGEQNAPRISMSKIIWARTVTPRHAYTAWFLMHHKIPVKSRLIRHSTKLVDSMCEICNETEEHMDHLFLQCRWAKDF
ncbi:hypothetical protein Cgig2_006828 [Carnegiea gigantea]|uniref:Reverse transcriptase zinc-binding domain-containing protein n=1 Tax=Carnegiea gigantea TaxID=171969 RepID=A0A9Q1Q430_9CARY|nr:hypothetical protein Cgig2_006828 [Carnegiea gigantea]